MTIAAVVFDWDGTLLDSMSYKPVNAGVVFSKQFGVDADTIAAAFRKHSGIPRRDLFSCIADDCGVPLEAMLVVYEELSADFTACNVASAQNGKLWPDVMPTLEVIRDNNIPMWISSSAIQSEIDNGVSAHAMAPFVRAAWGSRPSFSKGIDHIGAVCAALGCEASAVLMVGDDIHDVMLAKQAGAKYLRICRTGVAEKNHEITRLQQVLDHC